MTTLTFNIVANDQGAAKAIVNIGDKIEDTGKKMHGFKAGAAAVAVGTAAFNVAKSAAGALADVMKDSVSAYVEAEQAQVRLQDAFTRFPKLADVNIQSLRDLNSQLMLKTKFDDDAIASGQAVLAQFNLTGKQLQSITPVLLDYAAKTGQDLPSAAEKLGKSFLGNTKALKELGISYKSTGNQAKDTENITNLLRKAVGGFAEKEGQTAAGRAEILKNAFGEIQESIGQKLLPVLLAVGTFILEKVIPAIEALVSWLQDHLGPIIATVFNWIRENVFPILQQLAGWLRDTLIPALVDTAKWFGDNWEMIKNVAIVIAAMAVPILAVVAAQKIWAEVTKAVTIAQNLLNLAMKANPILLIVSLIAGLVAAFIILWQNSEGFRNFFIGMWEKIKTVVGAVVDFLVFIWNAYWGFYKMIGEKIAAIAKGLFEGAKAAVTAVIDWIKSAWNGIIDFFKRVPGWIGDALSGIGSVIGAAFKGALNIAIDVINWFIRRANDIIGGINAINPFGKIPRIPEIRRLHSGGVVPGPPGSERLAILEAGETVIPARGGLGAGAPVIINFNGPIGSSQELENWLVFALDSLRRRGRLA